jgi:hypothetical protein
MRFARYDAGPPVADVRLLAPLRPASIRDSISFEAHIEGARRSQEGATDLLASGTHQRGCLTEIWGRAGERVPPPLVPGDVVTCEVEALGLVTNQVVDPDPCPPIPAARRGQSRGPRH